MVYDFWGRIVVLLIVEVIMKLLCILCIGSLQLHRLRTSPCIKSFIEYMKILLRDATSTKYIRKKRNNVQYTQSPPHTHKPHIYMTLSKQQQSPNSNLRWCRDSWLNQNHYLFWSSRKTGELSKARASLP